VATDALVKHSAAEKKGITEMTATVPNIPRNEYFAARQKRGYHRSGYLGSLLAMIEFSMRSWSEVITALDVSRMPEARQSSQGSYPTGINL
jgi:hypothetical protein